MAIEYLTDTKISILSYLLAQEVTNSAVSLQTETLYWNMMNTDWFRDFTKDAEIPSETQFYRNIKSLNEEGYVSQGKKTGRKIHYFITKEGVDYITEILKDAIDDTSEETN